MSTEQNPVHTFTHNGIYLVHLFIMNSATNCMNKCEQVIEVNNINDCLADFSYYSDAVNHSVTFSNLSVGNATEFYWSFGDGSFATCYDTIHTYTHAGYYNVCLGILNPTTACYDIISKEIKVGDDNNTCLANFFYTVDTQTKTATFTDQSYGSPDEWTWDFGDGTFASDQNPVHVYSKDSIYKVQCVIKNNFTGCADYMVALVNVNFNHGLKCNYGYDVDSSNHKGTIPVEFKAAVYGDPAKYVWDFGDGTQDSTSTSPTHNYSSQGTYNVCLAVSDPTVNESDEFCSMVDVVDITTAIHNSPVGEGWVAIYPNPANNNIIIEVQQTKLTKNDVILIYNVQGVLLLTQPIEQEKTDVNINALARGVYIVKVERQGSYTLVKRLVKE